VHQQTSIDNAEFGCLRDSAFSLLRAREFVTARKILEGLIGLGEDSPTMRLAYAMCLIEMGEGHKACIVLSEVRAVVEHLPASSQPKLREALAAMEEMLPGNRWDPIHQKLLQDEAERMLPTLRRSQKTK